MPGENAVSAYIDNYAKKDGELRGLAKRLALRLEGQQQRKTEMGDTAIKCLNSHNALKRSGL